MYYYKHLNRYKIVVYFQILSNSILFIHILGLASRLCDGDPVIWHNPNVENCSTVEITKIREEANNLRVISAAFQNPNNSDRTLTIEPEVLETITEALATNTDKDDIPILPNDLRNVISTVEDIIR